jgi:eukaryotic-like serine/threonine-protein kinase
MSQNILLVDYEPRTVARVTEALSPLGCQVLTAKDIDAAVASCAKSEPRVVLITSVLPRLKVEDAITQLRARAGLRTTPILVLMSGYSGTDPAADAAHLGAQDIVAKPFSNEHLANRVRDLLHSARGTQTVSADTRADVLEALRRSAGLASEVGTVTSQELFGDIIESEPEPAPATTQRVPVVAVQPPAPAQPKQAVPTPEIQLGIPAAPRPAPATRRPAEPDTAVERALETTLAAGREAGRPKVREETGGASVDELLSQTLSGLQVQVPRKPAAKPSPAAPAPVVEKPPAPVKPAPLEPPAVELPPAVVAPPRPTLSVPSSGPLPGGTPFGQYELMEVIATGGMAEVYRARMRGVEGFQKIVAIKRILSHLTDNDEFVTMFIDEAKLAAQLQHPSIIHIYDLGKIDRSYYIAMEFIDGKDLRTILRHVEEKQKRLPLGLSVFVAARLAAALDYAHRKRDLQGRAMALVHRDVSPQNVLISFEGEIKLCDFGIAKAASKASHTRAGALKGKLQYMSPEQAWGKDIDHRSDIFSLGLVLYEMVTGRKAFAGDSELSILEQVRSPRVTLPRDIDPAIPPQVERIIVKALKENRDERYQTAAEMASDLDGIIQSLRPSPGSSELGAFVSELLGRERLGAAAPSAPAATEARPAPEPRPMPAPPAPAAHPPKVVVPAPALREPAAAAEVSHVGAPPRRAPLGLLIGAAVVVVAVVLFFVFFSGKRGPTTETAQPTPAADAVEQARQATAEEVARQEQELRDRLRGDTAASVPAAPAPAQQPPVAVPTRAVPVPTQAAAVPTQAPAEVPTEAPAPTPAPVATEPPPTQAPPAVAEPEPNRGPAVAEQPAVREGDLVDITTVDSPPQPLSTPRAVYPPLAARQRIGGIVVLNVLVDERGAVQDVKVLRGVKPDLGLDEAAQNAVRQWRYKPATKNGVRVKVWATQTVPFRP